MYGGISTLWMTPYSAGYSCHIRSILPEFGNIDNQRLSTATLRNRTVLLPRQLFLITNFHIKINIILKLNSPKMFTCG